MRNTRPLFFLGALYELLRAGILFVITTVMITPEIDQVKILLFVLLAAPGFVVFAGFLFIGVHPETYTAAAKLLAVGKIAGLFPAMIAALNSVGIITFSTAEHQLSATGLLFGIIILFDLLFCLFLVSYKKRAKKKAEQTDHELPNIEEVDLGD